MVFSSNIFLAYFLPAFLIIYSCSPKSSRNIIALLGSFAFYAWGAPWFCFLLLLSGTMDFYLARQMARRPKTKIFFVLGLVVNLLTLLGFKYFNFFIDNANLVFQSFGHALPEFVEVALPVGISFFTFQKISFLVDVYRKDAEPPRFLSDYLLFVFLFPQLIAGPIVRFKELASQLENRDFQENAAFRLEGFYRFVVGLAKKVLIADTVAVLADQAFAGPENLGTASAWIGLLAYSIQIYYDFSGYSDMAIGLGQMMGFRFPENFNFPYLSAGFREFWRRWHITLGTWMRDYLYIPLGGSRVHKKSRVYLNLWFVFALSGLWHGASWNFVLWGVYHGFFLVLERAFGLRSFPRGLAVPITALLVCLGWVLFRAENLHAATEYYHALFIVNGNFSLDIGPKQVSMLVLGIIGGIWGVGKMEAKALGFTAIGRGTWPVLGKALFYLLLLFLCMGSLAGGEVHPFIYFRF